MLLCLLTGYLRSFEDGAVLQFLLAIVERTPDVYLDELVEQLEALHGISPSISTVSRTLKLLGLSYKKVNLKILIWFRLILPKTY